MFQSKICQCLFYTLQSSSTEPDPFTPLPLAFCDRVYIIFQIPNPASSYRALLLANETMSQKFHSVHLLFTVHI